MLICLEEIENGVSNMLQKPYSRCWVRLQDQFYLFLSSSFKGSAIQDSKFRCLFARYHRLSRCCLLVKEKRSNGFTLFWKNNISTAVHLPSCGALVGTIHIIVKIPTIFQTISISSILPKKKRIERKRTTRVYKIFIYLYYSSNLLKLINDVIKRNSCKKTRSVL